MSRTNTPCRTPRGLLSLAVLVAAFALPANEAAAQATCDPSPRNDCFTAQKAKLKLHIDPNITTKNKLLWGINRGAETVVLGDLGDPVLSDTTYALCIYDGVGGVHEIDMRDPNDGVTLQYITVPDSSLKWRAQASNGFRYKDRSRLEEGVQTLRVRAGSIGRSRAKLVARGELIPMPSPVNSNQLMEANPSVVVQLVNDPQDSCWTTEYVDIRKNTGKDFRATFP